MFDKYLTKSVKCLNIFDRFCKQSPSVRLTMHFVFQVACAGVLRPARGRVVYWHSLRRHATRHGQHERVEGKDGRCQVIGCFNRPRPQGLGQAPRLGRPPHIRMGGSKPRAWVSSPHPSRFHAVGATCGDNSVRKLFALGSVCAAFCLRPLQRRQAVGRGCGFGPARCGLGQAEGGERPSACARARLVVAVGMWVALVALVPCVGCVNKSYVRCAVGRELG